MIDESSHPAADAPPVIEARNVSFSYAARRSAAPVLKEVAFSIQAGQMAALLGPNGCGKSTLLRLIAGALTPDAGEIRVGGRADAAERRRLLSIVFQRNGLDKHLSVRENLLFQAALYGLTGRAARERVEADLAASGLMERADQRVKTLSGGLARRAELCRALLHRPRVLLLDEPTAGLDPGARDAFLESLDQRRRDDGLTVLLTTHLVDEADRSDRVLLMHQGELVADGPPGVLRARLGDRLITLHGPASPPAMDGITWARRRGAWTAAIAGGRTGIGAIANELASQGRSFTIAPPTLGDLFEQLTGASLSPRADDDAVELAA